MFPLNPKLFENEVEMVPTRNGFGSGMLAAAAADENVVALCADLTESVRLDKFAAEYPNRFFEMGVSEQNMAGVAAGMAATGKIPFFASYAVFSPGRNFDQIRVSIAYSGVNAKIVGGHAGISVGPDGATHQGLEDIAMMRVLPGMTVVVPCDAYEMERATVAAAKFVGPVYLRMTREKTPVITTPDSPFEIGRAYVLRPGKDVSLIACGPLVYEALIAADMLAAKKISAEVINCATLKPLDEKTILASLKKTGRAVTIEEHQITGGLFGVISEFAAQNCPIPIAPIGMPNVFGESGEPNELLEKYGMKAADIVAAVQKVFKK